MARAPSPIGPRKARLFSLLTIAALALLTLLAAELLVRTLLRYNTPDTIRENSLQYQPAVYARHLLAPDQYVERDKAWGVRFEADRSGEVVVINEHGFRGRSVPLDKLPGGRRILVLGGSAVFDLRAKEGRDWPRLAEQELRAAGFATVEVINAGIPGHASADAVGRLNTHLWMLAPDIVVLYNAWNDVKTFRSLTPHRPLITLVEPYDPRANPFQSYRGALDRLLSRSQLYVKLRTRYFLRRVDLGLEGGHRYDDLVDAYSASALRQYRLNLELFVDASRNIGAVPVLLTQASLAAADSSQADRARINYAYAGLSHGALVRAMAECNAAIRQIATAEGTQLIDLAAGLSGRPELFLDHIHTTPGGSEELAAAVARGLTPLLRGDVESPQP